MKRAAALFWILIVAAVATAGWLRLSPQSLHTDVRALLPATGSETSAAAILSRSTELSKDVWILAGAKDAAIALKAADIVAATLSSAGFTVQNPQETIDLRKFIKTLSPYRESFLTDTDKAFLASADDGAILHRALSTLYRPLSIGVLPFADDPLGLFEAAMAEKSASGGLDFSAPRARLITAPGEPVYYALSVRVPESMSASGSMPLTAALNTARAAVQKAEPQARILASGVALVSEEAAHNASQEAGLIGSISAVGIIALVLIFFARFSPIVITVLVLGCSMLFTAGSVLAVFGEIHILTLVFGATLLGICADYVFHFLCAVDTGLTGSEARRILAKPLALSLATTCAGYAVMAFSPMPGLQQTALFCIAGLVSAFLSVMLLAAPVTKAGKPSRAALAFAQWFARLPRLSGKARPVFCAALAIVAVCGILQLKTQNELSLLNRIPAALASEMQETANLLSPVSPGQLFVIEGKSADDVLRINAVLREKLDTLAEDGIIARAPQASPLLQPAAVQEENRAIVRKANDKAIELVQKTLGIKMTPSHAPADTALTAHTLKEAGLERAAGFWLNDKALIVPLAGVTPEALGSLHAIEKDVPGVRFVNTTAEIAQSLADYRDAVIKALLAALAVIVIILAVAVRGRVLQYCLPTVLSAALSLGICGFAGISLSLFTVLPLILVLGLGVDYAIVLYSQKDGVSAGNSVFLAAASTLLAFGLLAFSSTPALFYFGFTLLTAIGCVLPLTVLLRPDT